MTSTRRCQCADATCRGSRGHRGPQGSAHAWSWLRRDETARSGQQPLLREHLLAAGQAVGTALLLCQGPGLGPLVETRPLRTAGPLLGSRAFFAVYWGEWARHRASASARSEECPGSGHSGVSLCPRGVRTGGSGSCQSCSGHSVLQASAVTAWLTPAQVSPTWKCR